MDQLQALMENFGVSIPKLAAQIILFLVVYACLNRWAFGPIINMLEERRRRIEEGQLNAEKIKRQLADAEKRYQEILQKANAEAEQLIDEARRSGEALTEKQTQAAIEQAADIVSKAQVAIEAERNRMISEVRHEMVSLVVNTTSKVTGKILTPADQERLNEETARQLAA